MELRFEGEEGPPHDKTFTVKLVLNGEIFEGKGSNSRVYALI